MYVFLKVGEEPTSAHQTELLRLNNFYPIATGAIAPSHLATICCMLHTNQVLGEYHV